MNKNLPKKYEQRGSQKQQKLQLLITNKGVRSSTDTKRLLKSKRDQEETRFSPQTNNATKIVQKMSQGDPKWSQDAQKVEKK